MIRLLINLSGRERLMLASFLVVMILLWGSSLLARWERASVTLGEARSEIRQQNVWIENAGLFEEKLQEVLAQVDPAKMMDGAALSAFVDSFARTNDLRYEITAPSSEQNSIFTESSLRATFRNVSLEKLVEMADDGRGPDARPYQARGPSRLDGKSGLKQDLLPREIRIVDVGYVLAGYLKRQLMGDERHLGRVHRPIYVWHGLILYSQGLAKDLAGFQRGRRRRAPPAVGLVRLQEALEVLGRFEIDPYQPLDETPVEPVEVVGPAYNLVEPPPDLGESVLEGVGGEFHKSRDGDILLIDSRGPAKRRDDFQSRFLERPDS